MSKVARKSVRKNTRRARGGGFSGVFSGIWAHFSFLVLSVFWLFALFNPLFKKYDYGAGFPLVVLFAVLIAVLAVVEFRKKRERVGLSSLFLLLFAVCVVASFVFSQTKNLGFSEVLAWGSMVPLYFLFARKKNEWTEKFLKVVLIGTIMAVVLGYFLYFFKAETRFIGPFFNTLYHAHVWPNAFALFLLMTWPVGLLFFEKKGKWATAVLIGFVLSALLLTYSRGALIVLGGQGVLLFIYFFRRIRLKTALLILLALGSAVFMFLETNYFRSASFDVIDVGERAAFENSESLTSATERMDFWTGAVELTFEKPLFGWGPFSFRQAYNPIQKTFLGSADHPHNIFLKISSEYGLIALFAFLAFLITVLVTVVKRFPKLAKQKRDAVYILGVSIAGAFAHNLIDYNFNFFVNLLLLFLLIIFVRSMVVGRSVKIRRAVLALILAVTLGLFSLYEGTLLVLSETVDESYLEYSFFPRNYYLNKGEEEILNGNLSASLEFSEKQSELNPLDSQGWYLQGVAYCYEGDLFVCGDFFDKVLELNPMNDFVYYHDYFEVVKLRGDETEIDAFIERVVPILNTYFEYVDNNVHFTAYTVNVEMAAALIDSIIPYLPAGDVKYFEDEKEEMLKVAEELRKNKTF